VVGRTRYMVNDSYIPALAARGVEAKALYDEGERKLLYVAATRARDVLVVTGCGRASAFVG
jgi:superfamily I DNA/RNA helicase